MFAGVASGILSAALTVIGKLATQAFFEKVLINLVVYCGDKLVSMTSNTLDDSIMYDVKKSLGATE